jgi:hypothetical protein
LLFPEIAVQSQPREIVFETLSQKNPSQKKAGGVDQGVDPQFKPQYYKIKWNNNLSDTIFNKHRKMQ